MSVAQLRTLNLAVFLNLVPKSLHHVMMRNAMKLVQAVVFSHIGTI